MNAGLRTGLALWALNAVFTTVGAQPEPPVHEPVLTDFASGAQIKTTTQASLYELQVPLFVYQGTRQHGLADVRVFNADGQLVPMGVSELAANPNKRTWQGLAAYPLDVPTGGHDDGRITLHRNAAGRIEFADDPKPPRHTERQFILDAARLAAPYQWLELKWARARGNFVQKIAVDAGDELNEWSPLVPEATIAYLRQSGGKVVRHNRVNFAPTSAKYLRIRFLKPLTAEPLPKIVSATVEPTSTVEAVELERLSVTPTLTSSAKGRFEFSLPFGLAMRHLTLHTDTPNAYVPVRLWNRMDTSEHWRQVGNTTVYNLDAGDASIRNRGLSVSGGTRRLWAFEPRREAGVAVLGSPTVAIRWRPHILVFVARGPAPYTLAFGSIKRYARHVDARHLLRQINQPARPARGSFGLPVAGLAEPQELAGPDAYKEPLVPADPRGWILWGALVLAVLVLLWMAWRLVREERSSSRDDSD